MVLDETTEEGRLFQTGKVWGKMNFSGHHHRQIVLYTVIHAMPEFALSGVIDKTVVRIIRILHECQDGMDKSVLRVTVITKLAE